MESASTPRRPGRPLSFDRGKALRRAMLLFWERGYEATTLADLTAALGVSPPSIYTAFGDKRRLFLEAVALYVGDPHERERTIRAAPTGRAAAQALLDAATTAFTGEETPPGCLLATAAITGSHEAAPVRGALAAIRGQIEAALRHRLERAIGEGETVPGGDADTAAALVLATIQGLSTLARDGAPRAKLQRIAAAVLEGWAIAPA